MTPDISVNRLAQPLVEALLARRAELGLAVSRAACGVRVVDAGIEARGGLEAGRMIAEICMGGLGHVSLQHSGLAAWPPGVHVHAAEPVLACLGSQYAGWSLSHGEGRGAYRAMGSGPARALAVREDLFKELNYRDACESGALTLETDRAPPDALLARIAELCGVAPERLTVILTPTGSLAGGVQIVARGLEVALHKTHELGFPLTDVVDGAAGAPLPPPAPDFVAAMGRTNDAILFAGWAHLFVGGGEDAARDLAARLPSGTSKDYGTPFARLFKQYDCDFFKIDPMLFSPAQIAVTHLPSGRTFKAGRIDLPLLEKSFAD